MREAWDEKESIKWKVVFNLWYAKPVQMVCLNKNKICIIFECMLLLRSKKKIRMKVRGRIRLRTHVGLEEITRLKIRRILSRLQMSLNVQITAVYTRVNVEKFLTNFLEYFFNSTYPRVINFGLRFVLFSSYNYYIIKVDYIFNIKYFSNFGW